MKEIKEFDFLSPKQQKELLRSIDRLKKNRCPKCGKKLKNAIDPITKKVSKYLWRCECTPKLIMCKG